MSEQRSDADQVHADAYESLVTAWLTLPEVGENNALMVPADFVQDGRVLKGLPGLLTLLSDARYSDDEAMRWLYTDDDLPGWPVQALRENRGTEVKRRAQALGF